MAKRASLNLIQIERLRTLHKMNFLHNDVKSQNVLVGHKDTDVVYLIDFGLSTPYRTPGGKHVTSQTLSKFNGNLLFASNNMCVGTTNSRRSDIESAFYYLIYMLNQCRLPWSDLGKRKNISFSKMLRERCK